MIKSDSKKSLFSVIHVITGSLGLLVFVSVFSSAFLSYQIFVSTDQLIETTLPKVDAINSTRRNIDSAYQLLPYIPRANNIDELLEVSALVEKIDNLLKEGSFKLSGIKQELQSGSFEREYADVIQLNIKQTDAINSLVDLKREIIIANQKLERALRTASVNLGVKIEDMEFDVFSHPSTNPIQKEKYYDIQTFQRIQTNIEKLSYYASQLELADTVQQATLIHQRFRTTFRDIIEEINYLTPESQSAPQIIAVLDIYTKSSTPIFYNALRLKQISKKKHLFELSDKVRKKLNKIFSDLNYLDAKMRKDYALGIARSQQNAKVALIISIFVLVTSSAILYYHFAVALPKHIVNPLRKATMAIKRVGNNEHSYEAFDTNTKELDEIEKSLVNFLDNARAVQMQKLEIANQQIALIKYEDEIKTFTRVSSHDLKSPLRGIRLLCKMALEDLEEGDHKSVVENINSVDSRVERLYNLLNSLLEYVKAGEKNSQSHKEPIGTVIENLTQLYELPADLAFDMDIDCPGIKVEEAPISAVLRNLIDNAIKHHDSKIGKIWIVVYKTDESEMTVEVIDDGPGIPETYQERIFEPFETLKPKDIVEGSGMGLAIIKKVLDRVGGHIKLTSPIENNRGVKFSITWPLTES